ncbi:MAG TPA: MmgE/PrpD family protein [Steroidobacteraceae bacterium]
MKLSRRTVLTGGTAAAAATALPLQLSSAAGQNEPRADPRSGESLALARYVTNTRYEDLPADVVAMTKRAILDAIGVSLAASGLEPACKPFIEFALESGGPREAKILGTGQRAPIVVAALANGSLAHAMDYEDAHEETRTHPNAAAVAAALPLAEKLGASGRDLITAIALGCDVVCRLARALVAEGAPPPGFYQPAIVGTFGATTAAAKLLGLSAEQVLDAWSLALCQNSCTQELQDSPASTIRAIREGPCARVGIESALLAAKGVRGFTAPFEGRSGFFVMYANGVQRQTLIADLGKRFAGRDISFKAWPSCRDTHIYVQAALELLNERPIDPAQIESVTGIASEQQMIVLEPATLKRRPETAIAAKFSLYFTLAAALIDRRVDFASFSDTALRRADVLALADRVAYRIDPSAFRDGHVLEIELRDGTVHRRRVRAAYGSPAAPMPDEALVEKFLDCGGRAMRPAPMRTLQRIADEILHLEAVPRIAKLLEPI